jgi:hypothetical protein
MPRIQVCVYDNASGDETKSIVEKIAKEDSRLSYHCHFSPVSPVQNFQMGMNFVNTPFFSILADDDMLAPNFYETALESLTQCPQAAFCLGSTLDVSDKGKIISAEALHWEENKLYLPPVGLYQVIKHYFNWTGSLFRTDLVKKLTLDESVKPIDFDFVLRLSAQFPFVISKKTCAFFIHHKSSYSSSSGVKLVWPSWSKLVQNIESIESLSFSQKKHAKNLMQLRLRKTLLGIAVREIESKQFTQAKRTLKICLTQFPGDKKTRGLLYILSFSEHYRSISLVFGMSLKFYRAVKVMMVPKSSIDFLTL